MGDEIVYAYRKSIRDEVAIHRNITDTVTVKGIYTTEANEELEKVRHSNYNYINAGGKGIRTASQECIQAMYNLTLVLPGDEKKLSEPKF